MFPRKLVGIPVALVLGLVLPAAALALGLRVAMRARGVRATMPTSQIKTGVPQVGALFSSSAGTQHQCTASVVDSSHGDLLLTAAHCVSGSGAGMVFAPGFHGGTSPYGRWMVTGAHLAPAWVQREDPHEDYAFLTVAPQKADGKTTEIQQVTGAYRLGTTARRGERITVAGYPAGTDNDPISCRTRVFVTHGFPSFNCRGYVDGTSGSPWLIETSRGPTIVGVIGGLNQGGCVDYTSYSSPLDQVARMVYVRASSDTIADTAPAPGGDDCS